MTVGELITNLHLSGVSGSEQIILYDNEGYEYEIKNVETICKGEITIDIKRIK